MSDHRSRVRKIDVEAMSNEQAEQLSAQIGKELAKIFDEANLKCNEMLNIYGLQTKIHYKIVQMSEKTEKKAKVSRRVKKELKTQSLE